MIKLPAVLLLLMGACNQGAPSVPQKHPSVPQKQTDPVPDYVEIVEGNGYRGALFTFGSFTVPGLENQGPTDAAPYGFAFRRSSSAEVAAFEASFARRWESLRADSMDVLRRHPDASDRLPDFRRQYVGYTDSTGTSGLWINFFPADFPSGPAATSGPYPDWMLAPIHFADGGPRFFQVWYSVDRDSTETVIFNGEA